MYQRVKRERFGSPSNMKNDCDNRLNFEMRFQCASFSLSFSHSRSQRTQVLHIKCKQRLGSDNFISMCRNAVRTAFGDKPVGKTMHIYLSSSCFSFPFSLFISIFIQIIRIDSFHFILLASLLFGIRHWVSNLQNEKVLAAYSY